MGKASRDKGKRGERELAKKLREYGYNCRRGVQYCGTNGDADVIGLPGVHIECKRVERLNVHEAMIQSLHDARAEELSTVMSRRDNSPWLVTMTLEDWMILYQAWEIERSNAHESNNRLQGDKKDHQLVKKVCILQNGKPHDPNGI